MDLVQFALAVALLVCCAILFLCALAFAVFLWKSSRSVPAHDANPSTKRFLLFFFLGTICLWIWSLLQTLLAFEIIPPRGVLPLQIIEFIFVLTGAILMISLAIQAIKSRNQKRWS
jgi:hypothetical protein